MSSLNENKSLDTTSDNPSPIRKQKAQRTEQPHLVPKDSWIFETPPKSLSSSKRGLPTPQYHEGKLLHVSSQAAKPGLLSSSSSSGAVPDAPKKKRARWQEWARAVLEDTCSPKSK